MEWVNNCNRICHPKLVHGKLYQVKLEGGHVMFAKFNVYEGGEEVAFLHESGQELSVKEIFI